MIIDNRLARASLSKSFLYCLRLREMDDNDILNSDELTPIPAKRARICSSEVFLAPLDYTTSTTDERMEKPPHSLNSENDEGHRQIYLPTVPCKRPPSILGNASSSTSSLTAHLSRPPLNIPSLTIDTPMNFMETSNPISMSDISALITKQNILSNSMASSLSLLHNAIDPPVSMSQSSGLMVNPINSSSIKLPINLSTLVPVSKQSLNLDNINTTVPPMPITTSESKSNMLRTKNNQKAHSFSMNTMDQIMRTLPSHLATSVSVPNSTKESKINSSITNKRSRLSSNHISSNSSFVWPGVDAIVESYRKHNQGEIRDSNR